MDMYTQGKGKKTNNGVKKIHKPNNVFLSENATYKTRKNKAEKQQQYSTTTGTQDANNYTCNWKPVTPVGSAFSLQKKGGTECRIPLETFSLNTDTGTIRIHRTMMKNSIYFSTYSNIMCTHVCMLYELYSTYYYDMMYSTY